MLLNFEKLITKYHLNIQGVIHIGAHYGEEYELYNHCGIDKQLWFEPLESNFNVLKNMIGNINDIILEKYALGNENKEMQMYVETVNRSQSSSLLKPKIHLTQYPMIKFDKTENVQMTRLDDYLQDKDYDYNFINIDVQGYELEVFKGAEKTLQNIDYIISEINRAELYENCVQSYELDIFLGQFGFRRVETDFVGGTWGDAFYIKR